MGYLGGSCNVQRKLCQIVIVFLLLASFLVNVTNANFKPSPVEISIISPAQSRPNSSTVPINVSITVFLDYLNSSEHRWVAYSLDGQQNVTMSPKYHGVSGSGEFQSSTVTAEGILSGLSEGYHSLTVYAKYDYGTWINEGVAKAKFSVGVPVSLPLTDEYTPIITINSPSPNQSFEKATTVPFSITITKPTGGLGSIRTVGYGVDGNLTIIAGENIKYANAPPTGFVFNGSVPAYPPIFMGNSKTVTLTGYLPSLIEGSHKIHVFIFYYEPSNDYCQTTDSGTTTFYVGNQIIQPNDLASPTPTVPELSFFIILPLLISMFSVAVITKLWYRKLPINPKEKKRKPKTRRKA